MKTLRIFIAISLVGFFQSCTDDFATVVVSYSKGTAIYGDMDAIRAIPLAGTPSEIVNPGKIFVSDRYLLIGEETQGIHVIDNIDPSNPLNVGFINIPGNREFFYKDNFIYAESYYDMLKIDISNPLSPILVSRVEQGIGRALINSDGQTLLGFSFEEVTEKVSKDDNVYYALNEDNYLLYDYGNNLIPPSAVPASFAGNSTSQIGSVNRIVAYEGYLYAVSRANLLVFRDESTLERVEGEQNWWGSDMETIYPLGDNLFIGAASQVMIMNISDPENPQFVSQFWHATSCDPVYPTAQGVAYVTLRTGDFAECPGDENALVVLDIDQIEQPVAVQEIAMISPYGLTLFGDRLYVGEGENGLKIFDSTNPRELRLEKWDQTIKAYDVLANPSLPDYILVAGTDGLSQYRISSQYEHVSTLAY